MIYFFFFIIVVQTDSEEFIVNKTEQIGAEQEMEISIKYEPSDMTTTIATVYVESEVAGNFM